MKQLLRSTTAYKAMKAGAFRSALVLFPDEKYLRTLLKECAKRFFGAEDGSRVATLIDGENFSDCLLLPKEGAKWTVDDCEKISEESLLAPVEGAKKLFLLDAFHTAPALVQNKLLKILEEPPEGVYFLLGASAEFSVLPTVLSRTVKYVVPPFAEEEVERALARKYPAENVKQAAGASGGIFSVGESLLSGENFALARRFLSFEEPELFCRELGERKDREEFFAALKSLLRDMLMKSVGQTKYVRSETPDEGYPTGALIASLELVGEAEKQIKFNANFASCLYALALGIKEEKEKWQR